MRMAAASRCPQRFSPAALISFSISRSVRYSRGRLGRLTVTLTDLGAGTLLINQKLATTVRRTAIGNVASVLPAFLTTGTGRAVAPGGGGSDICSLAPAGLSVRGVWEND